LDYNYALKTQKNGGTIEEGKKIKRQKVYKDKDEIIKSYS